MQSGKLGRGLRVSGVINDEAKAARVKLRGKVNGVDFEVERIAARKGRSSLRFVLGEEDLTTQEMAMTQQRINHELGADLLGRTSFYGQSEVSSLVESNDTAFKQELGKIVDLETWTLAKTTSAEKLKSCKQAIEKLQIEETFLRRSIKSIEDDIRIIHDRIKGSGKESYDTLRDKLRAAETENELAFSSLQRACKAASSYVRVLVSKIGTFDDFFNFSVIENEHDTLLQRIQQAELTLSNLQNDCSQAQMALGGAKESKLQKDKAVYDYSLISSAENESGSSAYHCNLCLQPIDKIKYNSTLKDLQEEQENAASILQERKRQYESLNKVLNDHEKQVRRLRIEHRIEGDRLANLRANAQQEWSSMQTMLNELRFYINQISGNIGDETGTDNLDILSLDVRFRSGSLKDKSGQILSELQLHKQALVEAKSLLEKSQNYVESIKSELKHIDLFHGDLERKRSSADAAVLELKTLTEDLDGLRQEAVHLREIDDSFRPSGIVSFILEEALSDLEEATLYHLGSLCPELTLELSFGSAERIEKSVYITNKDGNVVPRDVKQLSGGERRRLALALALGFTELAANRGSLSCDLLVLDEVMQHLDTQGCRTLLRTITGTVSNPLESTKLSTVGEPSSIFSEGFFKTILVVAQPEQYNQLVTSPLVSCLDVISCDIDPTLQSRDGKKKRNIGSQVIMNYTASI